MQEALNHNQLSHMAMPRTIATAAAFIFSCLFSSTAMAQVAGAHEKCLQAVDYKGCIESQGALKADEEIKTGILWDTAEWKENNSVVRLKVYRMRGGGFWVGSALRLSVMEVDCRDAEFDVESDGYSKQSIKGDAYRQAPLIYSRLCTGKALPPGS